MKMDKETLAKNQFWIGFGVFVVLVLIALFWLSTFSADANTQLKMALDKSKADLEGMASKKPPKTRADIAKMEERRVSLEKRKEEVWEKAWKVQEELMTWPADLQADLGKLNFGDPISVDLRDKYAQTGTYNPQLKQLAETFITTVPVGKETKTFQSVQFKDGWKAVLPHVENWSAKNKAPTVEEVWLAQEDIWVEREILGALKEAINSVARFRKVEGPAAAAGELFRQQFENSDWRLDLTVVQAKDGKYVLRGKIKNPEPKADDPPERRIKAQQKGIGTLYFLVQLHEGNANPVVLPVHGDTLAVGKEWAFADYPLDLANRPDGILGVMQLYDAHTSPIRRLDHVFIGQQSHRTFKPSMKMHKVSSGGASAGPAPAAKGGAAAPPPVISTIGDKRREPDAASRTEYGLLKERYADVTDQVRRLPVALVLLVDQWYIPEIEAALANCRLRFQIVQVGWHHYRGTIASDAPEEKAGEGVPKVLPGRGKADSGDEQAGNLVELKLYGVASLYERFKSSAPAGRDTAAAPAPAPADGK